MSSSNDTYFGGCNASRTHSDFVNAHCAVELVGNMTFQFRNLILAATRITEPLCLTRLRLKTPIKTPAMTMISVSRPRRPPDNFTQAIQSQILGGLLTNINTGKPGRMVTNDFIVDIANKDGQLQLNVTDRKTGKTSTIQVSGLQTSSTDF